MRILMVNKFLYPNGGSETYIFRLGEMLRRQGHEVQYFGMEHAGRIVGNRVDSYTADMDFHGSRLSKLTYPFKIIYSREARAKIRLVLEDFNPDAVHLNNINFQLTPSVIDEIRDYEKTKGCHVRILYTAHDYQWVCPNHMLRIPESGQICDACTYGDFRPCTAHRCIHGSRLRSILGTIEAKFYARRGTYEQVDTIICPSAFMNRMLSRNPIFKEKTVTLHNFMETEMLQGGNAGAQKSALADAADTAKKPAGETAGETGGAGEKTAGKISGVMEAEQAGYVLYFGRYSQEKGILTLLSACRQLPEIPFVFAGKGELEEMVNAVPNVENKGFLTGQTLQQVIAGAQFVVFPSEWYENCPFSVVEAQALGVPVLASDLGGTPELLCLKEGSQTGELFRGGDADSLTEAIHRLWQSPDTCQSYSAHTRAWMKHFDSLESYCDKLVKLYQGTKPDRNV